MMRLLLIRWRKPSSVSYSLFRVLKLLPLVGGILVPLYWLMIWKLPCRSPIGLLLNIWKLRRLIRKHWFQRSAILDRFLSAHTRQRSLAIMWVDVVTFYRQHVRRVFRPVSPCLTI